MLGRGTDASSHFLSYHDGGAVSLAGASTGIDQWVTSCAEGAGNKGPSDRGTKGTRGRSSYVIAAGRSRRRSTARGAARAHAPGRSASEVESRPLDLGGAHRDSLRRGRFS